MPTSPSDQAAYQAAGLAGLSNIIAQVMTIFKENKPLRLDYVALLQFVLFAFLSTPPNFHFQIYLEETFPAYHLTKQQEEKSSRTVQETKTLNLRNTAVKFLVDQVISGTINTYIFIAAFAFFRGQNISQACIEEFWPMRKAALKVWPLVSLLSYTVIPPEKRILFANTIGVLWGVFLCL